MIDEIVAEETLEEAMISSQDDLLEIDEEKGLKTPIKFGDILFNRKFKVFVKINEAGYVTNIASDLELKDTTGWTLIDEGEEERFVCASTMYFEEPIIDDYGNYRYKIR